MSHIYAKDGIEYPSVTTILHIYSPDDSLIKWANIMGFKKKNAEEIRDNAAYFGSLVHSHLQKIVDETSEEELLQPKDPFQKLDLDKTISHFKKAFSDLTFHTIYTEKTLYSDKYLFAGTLDWFADINGKKVLFDFKTSKTPYFKYRLQLGGYGKLIKENEGFIPDYGIIVIVNKDTCKMYSMNQSSLIKYGDSFLQLAKFYQMVNPEEEILSGLPEALKNSPDNQ